MLNLLFRIAALLMWYLAANAAYYTYHDQGPITGIGWVVVLLLLAVGAGFWKGGQAR